LGSLWDTAAVSKTLVTTQNILSLILQNHSMQHSSVPLYQIKQLQMKALKHLNYEVENDLFNCGDDLPLLLADLQQISLQNFAFLETLIYWKIGQNEGSQKLISVNYRLGLQHLKSKQHPLNIDTIGLSGLAHSLYSAFW
jgi:hypothetical protein